MICAKGDPMTVEPGRPLNTSAVPFRVEARNDGIVTCVTAGGELDSSTSEQLIAAVERAATTTPSRLVIDLEQLTFIDSTGVRALKTLKDEVGEVFRLERLSPQVHRLLDLTGMLDYFELDDAALRG
jgi:anti-sigma B factor antagonist